MRKLYNRYTVEKNMDYLVKKDQRTILSIENEAYKSKEYMFI